MSSASARVVADVAIATLPSRVVSQSSAKVVAGTLPKSGPETRARFWQTPLSPAPGPWNCLAPAASPGKGSRRGLTPGSGGRSRRGLALAAVPGGVGEESPGSGSRRSRRRVPVAAPAAVPGGGSRRSPAPATNPGGLRRIGPGGGGIQKCRNKS